MYVRVRVRVRVRVHVRVHVHVHVHAHAHVHRVHGARGSRRARAHMHTCTHAHTCTHTHMHTHTCTHMHTCTHAGEALEVHGEEERSKLLCASERERSTLQAELDGVISQLRGEREQRSTLEQRTAELMASEVYTYMHMHIHIHTRAHGQPRADGERGCGGEGGRRVLGGPLTYIYIRTHTCIYIRTHTYAYIYMHKLGGRWPTHERLCSQLTD